MTTEAQLDPRDTFSGMGRSYQEKVVQALMQDTIFADQMFDVMDPRFFDQEYLQEVTEKFFEHKRKFKTFPSADVLEVLVTRDQEIDAQISSQVREFLKRSKEVPLNGDAPYIMSSSLDFCKKQTMKGAILQAIDKLQESKYDDIANIVRHALAAGTSRDLGHEYTEGFVNRATRSIRKPLVTPWTVLDKALNGGWERGTIGTFIAPTGAGKSHFLVNAGAAGVESGMNVLYVSLEMADYKIGLRFDSYFSGVEINSIPEHQVEVEQVARSKVKGRLFIKEFPTKSASVQTIRSYIQRLQAIHNFTPDILVLDYADLLRGSRGYADKRYELEGNYEELRALAQEFNMVVLTADQTNRSGLDMEVVTIGQIGESYAKATVCDLIMTVSRTMEDKQNNTGRLFVAKSRLGRDGMIYPFVMNPATVKVRLLDENVSIDDILARETEQQRKHMADRYDKFDKHRKANNDK
jgi:archaellum biogenesis ATPase FlaH